MTTWNHYHVANTIQDALIALKSSPSPACLVAGGTDLLLELQQGHHSPVNTLVDISCLPELNCVEVRGDDLFIGSAVPVAQVATAPLVLSHAAAVSEASGMIGGPQVRNSATLGGNVAHALPAADGMIALVALDARAEIAALEGEQVIFRSEPILNLFQGPGKSSLVVGKELLTGFYLSLCQAGQSSSFGRVMRPQGVALPIINVAVWLHRCGDQIRDIRISVGPAGPVPQRALPVEAVLRGVVMDQVNGDKLMAWAAQAWKTGMHFRTSAHRASSEYRHHLIQVLFEQVFTKAWIQAANFAAEAV